MPNSKHILARNGGRHIFGTAKVGEKGQIVIPKEARELFDIQTGDSLLILGDDKCGLLISRPELIREAAAAAFYTLDAQKGEEK